MGPRHAAKAAATGEPARAIPSVRRTVVFTDLALLDVSGGTPLQATRFSQHRSCGT
jgi:hypothetical protein